MNRVTLQSNDNAAEGVLYMAMELVTSAGSWCLAMGVRSAAMRQLRRGAACS
jgi:hypothetical protein